MFFLFTSAGALALVGLAGFMIYRWAPEDQARRAVIAEWPWFVKGLPFPFALWMLMNCRALVSAATLHAVSAGGKKLRRGAGSSPFSASRAGIVAHRQLLGGGDGGLASCCARVGNPGGRMQHGFSRVCSLRVCSPPPCRSLAALARRLATLIGFAALLVSAPIVGYGTPLLHRPKSSPDVFPRHCPDEVRQILRGRK